MKLKITAVLTLALGLALFFTGALVTAHADTPHQCMRKDAQYPHVCNHSSNPQDWQDPTGKPDLPKPAKSHDMSGCSCPAWCFVFGGFQAKVTVPGIFRSVQKHGLFYRG